MKGIIFVGLQASGKSSFFLDRFYKEYLRINLDMLKTRHREKIIFDACLKGKQPCVIDNTNPTMEDRKRYIEAFKVNKFSVDGYFFQSKISDCLKRNLKRKGREKLPTIALKSTRSKLEIPKYSEGFDNLYYVSITSGGFDVEEWKNEIQ
ncbi:AAA family ATPase [Aliikangiella coralliicola]|uniref:ATP-binding protein n=1 Tax=Aliikangiella coralliicola TaxID=2592383 RepID=A0A545UEV3_9GAMM|nr:AAA family ATPase [Aliikangiella coralliicola]TQV88012.1 ATP-binding protein [Aliikangiella coralliicola]